MNAHTPIEAAVERLSTIRWEGERPPLAKALVAAQKAAEAVRKTAVNPAFRSKYADLATVVDAVVPALNDAGCAYLQFVEFDGQFVAITTEIIHESGSSVASTLHLRPQKSDPQGVASASTYGRRYGLLAMTGAAPEDDDGNAASGKREAQDGPVTAQQRARLGDLLDESGANTTAFLRAYNANSLDTFPASAFADAEAALKAKVAKKQAETV